MFKLWSKDIVALRKGRRVPFGEEFKQEPVGAPEASSPHLQQNILTWHMLGCQLKELLTWNKECFV